MVRCRLFARPRLSTDKPITLAGWGVRMRDLPYESAPAVTVGKVSTDRQYKKFSSTDGDFFCTGGI